MTKIVCFSDTHRYHDNVVLPEVDISVFAGDCAGRGSAKEVEDFIRWYATQPHKHKIMIAGNHDWGFEGALHFQMKVQRQTKASKWVCRP